MPLPLCQKKKKKKEKRTAKWNACLFVLVIAQLFCWWCCAGVKSCQVDSGFWLFTLLFLVLFKNKKEKKQMFLFVKKRKKRESFVCL